MIYVILIYLVIGVLLGGYVCSQLDKPDSEYRKFIEKEKVDDVYDGHKGLFFIIFTLAWLPAILLTFFQK